MGFLTCNLPLLSPKNFLLLLPSKYLIYILQCRISWLASQTVNLLCIHRPYAFCKRTKCFAAEKLVTKYRSYKHVYPSHWNYFAGSNRLLVSNTKVTTLETGTVLGNESYCQCGWVLKSVEKIKEMSHVTYKCWCHQPGWLLDINNFVTWYLQPP